MPRDPENRNSWQRAYNRRKPHNVRKQNLKKYGLTPDQFDAIHQAQGGVCAACGRAETTVHQSGTPNSLSVDHDHETGQARGLLCSRCNRALGLLGDSTDRIKKLLSYRERF